MADWLLNILRTTNLPEYVKTIRATCENVKKTLTTCASSCFYPPESAFNDIQVVFSEAVNNLYARGIVAEYDLAALALSISNPNGQRSEKNRINYSTGGPNINAICCDRFKSSAVPGGIPLFVAQTMLKSGYIIGWNNPNTNKLLDAIVWSILTRNRDDADAAYNVQMTLLDLLRRASAPVPKAWSIPLLDAIETARGLLAERNLSLQKRQAFNSLTSQVIAALQTNIGAQSAAAAVTISPSAPFTPSTAAATTWNDQLKSNWKPIVFLGSSLLAAVAIILLANKNSNK